MEDQRTKVRDIVRILPEPGRHQDKAQHAGTVPAIPGRLATMRMCVVCDGLAKAVLELPGVMAAAGYLTSTAAFVLLAAACCVLSLPPAATT